MSVYLDPPNLGPTFATDKILGGLQGAPAEQHSRRLPHLQVTAKVLAVACKIEISIGGPPQKVLAVRGVVGKRWILHLGPR